MPVTSQEFARTPGLPALVLVHGLGSAGNIWKSIHAGLEDAFTIYPVDLPGHGSAPLHDEPLDPRSLARSIATALEKEFGVREFHVAGLR